MKHDQYKTLITQTANALGFFHVGFSTAGFLEEEAPRLEHWLNQNYHGKMAYMANHFDKRLDPRLLEPGTKTIISLLLNYFPEKTQQDPSAPQIAKYAYGKDYHHVIKVKLRNCCTHFANKLEIYKEGRLSIQHPSWIRHGPKKPVLAGLVRAPT